MFERTWRCGTLCVLASGALLVAGQAGAQHSSGFEAPTYSGSAAGEIITGQDGYYIPVAGSIDGLVYTYAGNTYGVVANPTGGDQFAAARGDIAGVGCPWDCADPADGNIATADLLRLLADWGGPSPCDFDGSGTVSTADLLKLLGEWGSCPPVVPFVRAQRDMSWGDGTGPWSVAFDVNAMFTEAGESAQNIGSFSTQPFTGGATFIALMTWTDPLVPTTWQPAYVYTNALGSQLNEPITDAGFTNLAVNHWYRWETIINLSTNEIVEVNLTDLTTNVTSTHIPPESRYLLGGASGGEPTPTGFRLFGGSGTVTGNMLSFDNVTIDAPTGTASGACCFTDGSCSYDTQASCGGAGGIYAGDWTACGTCVQVPESCGKGAGSCGEPNGTPGCDDELCCSLTCNLDSFCCDTEWDSSCVDNAIGIGCVCVQADGLEGVSPPVSDDFDSYANGQVLDVNGWGGWDDDAGSRGVVSNAQSNSAPNSISITLFQDATHQYVDAACEGAWVFSCQQYIPSTMTGTAYFIMLNTYADGGDKNWSTQVNMSAATGLVTDDVTGNELTLVTDAWAEIRVEVDLDLDTQDFYYNGALLYSETWSDHVSGGGAAEIRCLDLWGNGASVHYYDDVSLTQP